MEKETDACLLLNWLSVWYCDIIILVQFVTVFQDRKFFGAQFGELENVYKITQETLAQRSSLDFSSGAFCNYSVVFHTSVYIRLFVI